MISVIRYDSSIVFTKISIVHVAYKIVTQRSSLISTDPKPKDQRYKCPNVRKSFCFYILPYTPRPRLHLPGEGGSNLTPYPGESGANPLGEGDGGASAPRGTGGACGGALAYSSALLYTPQRTGCLAGMQTYISTAMFRLEREEIAYLMFERFPFFPKRSELFHCFTDFSRKEFFEFFHVG